MLLNKIVKYAFLMCIFLLVSCEIVKKQSKDKVLDLVLSPYQVDCEGPFPQKCFVEIKEDGSKEFFYESITGFNFEPGYQYKIRVKLKPRCNENKPEDCPQDIGMYEYILQKIISKTKSSATYKSDFSENNSSLEIKKDTEYDISMYPKAKKGYKRVIMELPKKDNELNFKVEVFAKKRDKVDCNKKLLTGKFIEKTVEGWSYPYYEFTGTGTIYSTLAGCPDGVVKDGDVFSEGKILYYNSRLPLVVYVKEGLDVSYAEWILNKNR